MTAECRERIDATVIDRRYRRAPDPPACRDCFGEHIAMARRPSFFANAFTLLKQTAIEWMDDKAPQLGAALAYYTVFSETPLVLLPLAIIGALFRDDPSG